LKRIRHRTQVSVRTYEVHDVRMEARGPRRLGHRPFNEGDAPRCTQGANLGSDASNNVRLPVDRTQRAIIVLTSLVGALDPGQTVSRANAALLALAQSARSIFDCGLGQDAKEEVPSHLRPAEACDHPRHDVRTDDLGDRAAARSSLEDPVNGRDETPRERDPLGLIRIEHDLFRAPLEDPGDLPREVHRVTEPRVHALPSHRTVDVGRVTQEEHAAPTEGVRHAVMHPVRREPVDAPHVEADAVDRSSVDIPPFELAPFVRCVVPDGADQKVAGNLELASPAGSALVDLNVIFGCFSTSKKSPERRCVSRCGSRVAISPRSANGAQRNAP
jgi:hypothetical protein